MKLPVVTVSSTHQIVIPEEIRRSAGITPGTRLMVIDLGGVIRLLPVLPAAARRGIASSIETTTSRKADRL